MPELFMIIQVFDHVFFQILIPVIIITVVCLLYYSAKYLALKKNENLLVQKYDSLISQKQQLEKDQTSLNASIKQLNKANHTKDQFFLMISQDLKTPLLDILTFLQTLNNRAVTFSQEELKDFAYQMNISVKGLLSLLDNLLQWSRFQSGKVEAKPELIQLKELLLQNLDELKVQIEGKNLRQHIQLPEILAIHADPKMIQTVLRNLLSHAVAYAKNYGKLSIAASTDLTSSDLFIQYELASQNNSPKNDHPVNNDQLISTGDEHANALRLNLLICKEFIENNNGKLLVSSESIQVSSFLLRFFN